MFLKILFFPIKKDLQSNSANTDTEGAISVRILKRVEIKENLKGFRPRDKVNMSVTMRFLYWARFDYISIYFLLIKL